MARPKLDEVLSHWNALHEGFQTSTQEFYAAVEEAVERRQISRIKKERIIWQEGGVLTSEREYLRIQRERLVFDICAAPFGTGSFFSWWLVERRPLRAIIGAPVFLGLVYAAYYGLGRAIWMGRFALHLTSGFWATPFFDIPLFALQIFGAFFVVLWLARLQASRGLLFLEDGALAIPGVNWVYERFFRPLTYYWIDTTIMFQTSVHRAVMEVIQAFTTAQGIRALTADETKPVFQRFIRE